MFWFLDYTDIYATAIFQNIIIHNINRRGILYTCGMDCCQNTIDLGCYDGCGSIAIDNPTYTGDVFIDIKSNNTTIHQTTTATAGNPIVINLSYINENSCHTMRMYDSNGEVLVINGIDCYNFRTKIINRRYEARRYDA